MIAAAFALLSCFGAWMTWRRNPFYSARAGLKLLGTTLVLLAAAVGLIVLTLRLIDGRPVAVQAGGLAAAVILCTWGLIVGISAVSVPAAARLQTRLPPGVALVNLNRARLQPWLRRTLVLLGALLLLTLVPGPVRFIAASVAALVGGLGTILLPIGYLTARRTDRAVTALQLHPWVHWHYAADVWQAWSTTQAERLALAQATILSPPASRRLMLCLAGFAALLAAALTPGSALVRAGWAIGDGLFVLGIAQFARTSSRRVSPRRVRQWRAAPPDTFFGHDGVLCNGEFCAWRTTDVYLRSASVDAGPPRCIEFWFEKILPGGYGGSQVTQVRQQVLIAADASVSDLPSLQAALVARCPDARITLA